MPDVGWHRPHYCAFRWHRRLDIEAGFEPRHCRFPGPRLLAVTTRRKNAHSFENCYRTPFTHCPHQLRLSLPRAFVSSIFPSYASELKKELSTVPRGVF